MAKLLEVRNLVVHFYSDYGVVEAIDECNFSVNKGEILGLIGESGCGKTTTARAILGVIPSPPGKILKGDIIFQGQNLLRMEKNKLNSLVRGKAITLIPQDPFNSFNPLFTIGTQILDIIRWKSVLTNEGNNVSKPVLTDKNKRKFNRDRIINMLKQVQIPSPELQLRKYPHELSGGQRQRILIAMALLSNPLLIIADEPTTALDVTIEAQVLQLLRNLVKKHGVSVLYITHDLGVASQICDKVVIMYAGQVVEIAPITSFFANPLHPYTRKLLDSLPNPSGKITDIPGEVPHLVNPPSGCRFHTRCEFVQPRCKLVRPKPEEIFSNHWVRCYSSLNR